jgi:hypothetical protein
MRHIGRVSVARATTDEEDLLRFRDTLIFRAIVALAALLKGFR